MKKTALFLLVLFMIAAIGLSACTLPYRGTPAQPTFTAIAPGEGYPVVVDTEEAEVVISEPAQAAAPSPQVATATPEVSVTTPAAPAATPVTPEVVTPEPATEVPPPTTAAPSPQAEATRVQFQSGATSAYLSGELLQGASASYALDARSGQTMEVDVWSPNGDVYLAISGKDGKSLIDASVKSAHWLGTLPASQDYIVTVTAGDGQTSYGIDVSISALSSTPGPSPTPSANTLDPNTAFGTPKLVDAMDGSNKAGWVGTNGEYPNTDNLRISVDNGKFFVTGKQAGWSTWWFSWPEIKDFYIELAVDSGTCSGKDAYGLIFRGPPHLAGKSHGYVVSFACDGSYKVFRLDSADPYTAVTLVDWTKSENILSGSNQTNRLGVKADGSTLVIYANGHKLTELKDANYTEGRYGLFVSPADTQNYTYRAVRLAYWLLK